jgi:hypothetical protein
MLRPWVQVDRDGVQALKGHPLLERIDQCALATPGCANEIDIDHDMLL